MEEKGDLRNALDGNFWMACLSGRQFGYRRIQWPAFVTEARNIKENMISSPESVTCKPVSLETSSGGMSLVSMGFSLGLSYLGNDQVNQTATRK